jgi:hypothetical protein
MVDCPFKEGDLVKVIHIGNDKNSPPDNSGAGRYWRPMMELGEIKRVIRIHHKQFRVTEYFLILEGMEEEERASWRFELLGKHPDPEPPKRKTRGECLMEELFGPDPEGE